MNWFLKVEKPLPKRDEANTVSLLEEHGRKRWLTIIAGKEKD